MNYIRHMSGFFARLKQDQRMTPFHVSLYMALFQVWNMNRFRNPFTISRDEIMHLSRIGSINTYSKCMKQLQEWGYIRYNPTANNYFGSHVTCICFDTGSDTSCDTRSDTGCDTSSDTASYYINNTNFNKRYTDKNFNNGRGKKLFTRQQISFSNDKDYSEPL